MKSIVHTFFLLLAFAGITHAQSSTHAIVKEWERAKDYTKEYMEAMPEKDYSFRPTPEMRSFAAQYLHLTDANYGFLAAITGEKSPYAFGAVEKSGDTAKTACMKVVMEGYDFAINAIRKMTPAQLDEKIKMFGKFELTKGMALGKAFEHQTHHRGQTTVYLRLAGVKPPQEKLF